MDKRLNDWHKCFNVGFRICGGEHDNYLDDISGLNHGLIKNMSQTLLTEFDTYVSSRKSHAYKMYIKDLEAALQKKKKFNHYLSKVNKFNVSKNKGIFTSKGKYGYALTLPEGHFVEMEIRSIGIQVKEAGNLRLSVIDLNQSMEVFSKDYEVKHLTTELKIGEFISSAISQDYFISVELLGGTKLHYMDCMTFDDCQTRMCGVQEVFGLMKCDVGYLYENIEWVDNKSFCLNASIGCNFNKMVCEYSEILKDSFTHKMALVFLDDKVNGYGKSYMESSNINITIDVTIPKMIKEYKEMLQVDATNLLAELENTVCFSCDPINGRTIIKGSYS